MDIGGSEDDLKVVAVGGLEIIRLDKEERLKVGLHIEEPRRQTAVQEQTLSKVASVGTLCARCLLAFGILLLIRYLIRLTY